MASYAANKVKGVMIAALCVVAALAVGGGITYSLGLWGGSTVPDLEGMMQEEATAQLESLGLAVDVKAEKSDLGEGSVLGTDPPAGTRVESGSTVTLLVAAPRVIPDIVGMPMDKAKEALEDEGFVNVDFKQKSSDKEEGSVLSVAPETGTKAESETLVTVTYATPHVVPDVVGMDVGKAEEALEAAGYSCNVGYVYGDDVQENTVSATDPAAGTSLASGAHVKIDVWKVRSAELEKLTRSYLEKLSKVTINGRSYEIDEISSITYAGEGKCNFVLGARPFETHSWFGSDSETRYGNKEPISGSVTFDESNKITSVYPDMTEQNG